MEIASLDLERLLNEIKLYKNNKEEEEVVGVGSELNRLTEIKNELSTSLESELPTISEIASFTNISQTCATFIDNLQVINLRTFFTSNLCFLRSKTS